MAWYTAQTIRDDGSATEPNTRSNTFIGLDTEIVENLLAEVDSLGESSHRSLVSLLQTIDPELHELRPIKLGKQWIIHATYQTRSVPFAMFGDGMKRLFQVACHFAPLKQGDLAILEEPECFQHARSLDELVKLIWAVVERGVQVVLSSHSLELLDRLWLAAKEKEDRMNLKGGQLRSVPVTGAQTIQLREELAEDLR